MGSAPCTLLEVELALDHLEAQLAAELPAHMRAFARAYLEGRELPGAPDAAGRRSSSAIGWRALALPVLADRALALLRLVVPIVIERDAGVRAARRAAPTWPALQVLAQARDAAAHGQLGRGLIELVHRLHGAGVEASAVTVPAPIVGWLDPEVPLDAAALDRVWSILAARHGVIGTLRLERADVRPRAFVVEARGEVIVAVPRVIATPGARFAVLHELGHAVANLSVVPGLPRAVDEAAASYIARSMEAPGLLPARWHSPLTVAARARRTLLARQLDLLERTLPTLGDVPAFTPPWALWHDPGAQAAYVTAERIADRLWAALGPEPGPGALAASLDAERARIDADIAAAV